MRGPPALRALPLTVSGLWRAAAVVLDALLEGLAREWTTRGQEPDAAVPAPAARALRAVAALATLARRAAGAVGRLTAAHRRLAVRLDDRLLRFAA